MTQTEIKFQLRLISGKSVLRFTEIKSAGYIYVCICAHTDFFLKLCNCRWTQVPSLPGQELVKRQHGPHKEMLDVGLKLKN